MGYRSLRLALVFAGTAGIGGIALPQAPVHLQGEVRDSTGHSIPDATVVVQGALAPIRLTAGDNGDFSLDYSARPGSPSVTIQAFAGAMESSPLQVSAANAGQPLILTLHLSSLAQQVTVTATRSSLDLPATAHTIYTISAQQLNDYPASNLDDKLRQQAGFELFRRSSSRVQNPTSQGISLRGLGSTAASRSLVLADNAPLNDPFGGWIHWNEIPSQAVEAVNIATGGGSDLYGSSALGGVIDVVPSHPTPSLAQVAASGGSQDTSAVSVREDAGTARTNQLLAADLYRTAGYIPTAPSVQGPVDRPSNVHSQAGRLEFDHLFGQDQTTSTRTPDRAFLVGNVLNEARGNGSPLQTNATRLWRYLAGDGWSAGSNATGRVRLFGSDEGYRQSFSSINAPRTVETLTRLQRVHSQELGASSDASFSLSPVALIVGADVRDIRATDNEVPIALGLPNGVQNTTARQRFLGGFAEALAAHRGWSGALSLRLDSASNLDTAVIALPSSAPQPSITPNRGEFIASPRFGLVRELPKGTAIHASVFRAFRTPTMNELYRTGQVGQETTQANSQLASERATGWETGATYSSPGAALHLAGTYFWTEINRPVSAVVLQTTATSILEKRENLGQIVSQGTELHLDVRLHSSLSATLGYQYAHAIVTRFSAQPSLVGNWIPEVPRESFTAQLRYQRARIGEFTVAARSSGQAFDDSANTFLLHRFFQLDLAARHQFGPRWAASVMLQNVTDQRPEVARTPLLTLGTPIFAQGGVAFTWDKHSGP